MPRSRGAHKQTRRPWSELAQSTELCTWPHGELLHNTGSSAWGCDDLEGWAGGAGGRETREVADILHLASQMAIVVKNTLPMQETKETQVQSLGCEDPLEEGMAIHSSILAWRVPCTEEPGGLPPIGSQRVRHD